MSTPTKEQDMVATKQAIAELKLKCLSLITQQVSYNEYDIASPRWRYTGRKDGWDFVTGQIKDLRKEQEKIVRAFEKRWPDDDGEE